MTTIDYKPKLFVKQERFDWGTHIPTLKKLAEEMSQYLSTVRRTGISRHALMGPIGKLLRRANMIPFPDTDLFTNELLKAQEQGGTTYVSEKSREHIEKVSSELAELLQKVPRTRHRKVLELLGDMVYARRRIEFLKELSDRSQYVKKHLSDEDLRVLKEEYKYTDTTLISLNFANRIKEPTLKEKIKQLLDEFQTEKGIFIDETLDENEEEL